MLTCEVSATQRSEFEFFILYALLNISIKYHLNLMAKGIH